MKKSLFFVALAATALTGCKKDDSFVNPNQNKENGVAIALNLSTPMSIETITRSTGAVGDLNGEEGNVWKGQKLNVFMLETGNLYPAKKQYDIESEDDYGIVHATKQDSVKLFYDTEVTAPDGETSGAANYGYETKYYPISGTYDFFAYHADDAHKKTNDPSQVTKGEGESQVTSDVITVNVDINGSQDLMIAKAAPTSAEKDDLLTIWKKNNAGEPTGNLFYSAFAARRDVQPNFQFRHLLSRFVFNVTPGNAESAGETGIRIDTIYIKEAKHKATMVVASTDNSIYEDFDVNNFLTWQDDTKRMDLQEFNEKGDTMWALQSKLLEWDEEAEKGKKTPIGESLLLPANVSEYELVMEYSERPHVGYTETEEYEAAKLAAFKAAYGEAKAAAFKVKYDTEKNTAKGKAREEAYKAAKEEAYKEAKRNAYLAAKYPQEGESTVSSTEDVDDWAWIDPADGLILVLEVAEGNEATEKAWEWGYTLENWDWTEEAHWSITWKWMKDENTEYTVENWDWTEGATTVTEDNWVWDGEADWVAEREAYANRAYRSKIEAVLKLQDGMFEAGKQYNVNFTVFGLKNITLNMTLTGWEQGDDLYIDNDGPFVPIAVEYEEYVYDGEETIEAGTENQNPQE